MNELNGKLKQSFAISRSKTKKKTKKEKTKKRTKSEWYFQLLKSVQEQEKEKLRLTDGGDGVEDSLRDEELVVATGRVR